MHEVADNIYVYTDGEPSGTNQATTNGLIVISDEGVLIGDGLGSEASTQSSGGSYCSEL